MRDAESRLREWGCHWRARLEGCPKERLGGPRDPILEPGDNAREEEALRALYPRLSPEEARELRKYGPLPRGPHSFPPIPGIAELERDVQLACSSVGEALWERFRSEQGLPQGEGLPGCDWQGRLFGRIGVRYLVRQVYVVGIGTRSRWLGSSFDWLFPYAMEASSRHGSGREATLNRVKEALGTVSL